MRNKTKHTILWQAIYMIPESKLIITTVCPQRFQGIFEISREIASQLLSDTM